MDISDSALSQRRPRLGAELFLLVMSETLRPRADARLHPECSFAGLLLVGIDGTRWSVGNTPQHLARTRRGSAAVGKIHMSVLVELGTHAPLAACALKPRRARSCQRKVRQPVNQWPRLLSPSSLESPAVYETAIIA